MDQESVEESVLLDVFTSLKLDKNRGYIVLDDFKKSLVKYRPKCLADYYPDQESLESCCEEMFTNMYEASLAVKAADSEEDSIPDEGGIKVELVKSLIKKKP
jgi:hypothetical protein